MMGVMAAQLLFVSMKGSGTNNTKLVGVICTCTLFTSPLDQASQLQDHQTSVETHIEGNLSSEQHMVREKV
jgi:hypothetical protein